MEETIKKILNLQDTRRKLKEDLERFKDGFIKIQWGYSSELSKEHSIFKTTQTLLIQECKEQIEEIETELKTLINIPEIKEEV